MSRALGTLLVCTLLAGLPCAFGLDPALDVSQYAHTSWKLGDGFPPGPVLSIAQTPDGYLWVGTDVGLIRFDGVRSVPWQASPEQHLPSNDIWSLLAARDGTLWVGTSKGLASWKDGKLMLYPELSGQSVISLIEDHEGTVWAGTWEVTPSGRLCTIQGSVVHCEGDNGILGFGVLGLYEDQKGNLWAGSRDGLWRWKPGPPKFYPTLARGDDVYSLVAGKDGALLIGARGTVMQIVNEKLQKAYPLPSLQGHPVKRLLFDRDGGLWIATLGSGIVHIHQGRTDVFTQLDGLSDNYVGDLFEDREGNIWVATVKGLDRFREFAVATFSVKEDLHAFAGTSVLAARDGSVWAGGVQGLGRLKNGKIMTVSVPGLPVESAIPLLEDPAGRIWLSTQHEVGYIKDDRYTSVNFVAYGFANSMVETRGGDRWIARQDLGLFHLLPTGQVQQIPWSSLGHKDPALVLSADQQRSLWLGFANGGITYFADGQVRASYTAANGLGQGRVSDLWFESDGTLWVSTEGGLSRLKDGRVATLTSRNGLPCDEVQWVVQDDLHSFWLKMVCGLVRIARPQLDAWVAAVEKGADSLRIQATVFDNFDGIRSQSIASGLKPQIAKSLDGKLWFSSLDGVSVIDPKHLPFNSLAPPVHIEQVTADRKRYDLASAANGRIELPPLVRDLEIDYTALSLVAPEKVLFRYKLEGFDPYWQDAGTRRQAFYNNLPPRNYRFRVAACNNSGVWNEAGASIDFSIAPAYYQATWFRLSVVGAFLALLAGLYQLRLQQVARQYNIRLEERVNERTRIARDLHDTLLQSFQGLLLKFSTVKYVMRDRPDEAEETLERYIDQARSAITEGRDAVEGLRSSTLVANDLARAITTFGERLAADQSGANCPEFRVYVEGKSRDLSPLVRDEVYKIACESLRNAFRHAQAHRIEVQIGYDPRQFRLQLVDNGKGIDPAVLRAGGSAGHHGLPGIHERAKLVGGKLAIWSELDSGTEIELTIPAGFAYAKLPVAPPSVANS